MPKTDFHRSLDPDLRDAASKAQATFKHFWYHVATDFNRIIPALGLACVKAPFSDDFNDPNSPVEHMWIDEVYFDGLEIRGVLLNAPNELASVSKGEDVTLTLDRIEDWLCAYDDDAQGGYSVQVLRSRMSEKERLAHDEAWGLNFPAPSSVSLPERSEEFEENVLQQLKDQIQSDRSCLTENYGEGRTLLHMMSLYGRQSAVRTLLDAGADPAAQCDRGWTAIQYAKAAGWDDIVNEFGNAAEQ